MSFNSWKKEFYSPITKVAKKDAAAHSLQKWIGLRDSNLAKHDLELQYGTIVHQDRPDNGLLRIDGDSCSLCLHNSSKPSWRKTDCSTCPIKITTGETCDDDGTPYQIWQDDENPEPMIKLLQKIVTATAA